MTVTTRWVLPPDALPEAWFNALPRLGDAMAPASHPTTGDPIGPEDLAPLLGDALIGQEVSMRPWIDVPGGVLDVLRRWRPTPLVRARALERALATPARIYYKDESASPSGSHHPNSAVAQAFYGASEGARRMVAGTGAGAWGSALALACSLFGLECKVYMARSSFEREPLRRVLMRTWGAEVAPSPVDEPTHPGSQAIAASDAVADAAARADTRYGPGSVLNHVLLHQTVIGLEAREQLAMAGEGDPDVVIGCCGGGSNFGGVALPFLERRSVRLVAVESSSWPTLTAGRFGHDHADAAGLTPPLAMYTLGRRFLPPSGHAGGLAFHGAAPIVSHLVRTGRVEAMAYPQAKVFEAAVLFARCEGGVPAPETGHAVRAAVDEALAAREEGAGRVILFSYSGHGLLDLGAYDDHMAGRLGAG